MRFSSEQPADDPIRQYYEEQTSSFGRSGITDYHRDVANAFERILGKNPHHILELGCGNGAVAAELALRGHKVTGVDFSRPDLELALENVDLAPDRLEFICADFYSVTLPGSYDAILYWDGFGVGSDPDQRRLLRRVEKWLSGSSHRNRPAALIDVFSPFYWSARSGDRTELATSDGERWSRTLGYDYAGQRMIDRWEREAGELGPAADRPARVQSLRCYAPVDLALLLEPVGLSVRGIFTNEGENIPSTITEGGEAADYFRDNTSYLALVERSEVS